MTTPSNEKPINLTAEQVRTIRCELARLAKVRDKYNDLVAATRLMGFERLADNMGKPLHQIALAEGEIAQAIFGTR